MFDKKKFAQIIKDINNTYESQRDFSKKSKINRTSLSQYMNMKLDKPPKPDMLEKLAQSSNDVADYLQLMSICGYLENDKSFSAFYSNSFKQMRPELKDLGISDEEIDSIFDILGSYSDNPDTHDKKASELLKKYPQAKDIFVDFAISESNFLDYYLNKEDYKKIPDNKQYYMCPVYGRISAGQPNWAEECIEGRIPIDPELMDIINPEEYFFLRVNGESMNKVVKNGAYALIHKQDMVENGEIAVVLVNGDEATLKHFSKKGDIVVLTPESNDTSFEQQIYSKETPIQVIGKYVGKMEINK